MKIVFINIEGCSSIFFSFMQEMLAEKGHECKYLHIPIGGLGDIDKGSLKQIVSELKPFCKGVGLIGFSCMTNTFIGFKKIAVELKSLGIPIIVGGIHPTVRPEECLDYADYVCVGEGEKPLLELVDRIEKKKPTEKIKNLYMKRGEKVIRNDLGPIVKDLDTLPVPTFNLKNTYYYNKGKIKCVQEHKELLIKEYGNYYFIITSRGCPYRCKYCLNDCLIQINPEVARIRQRSKEHIIKELKNIKKILPKTAVIGFVDDDFCARGYEELKDICEAYKKEIGLPFFCASTPTFMSEDKVKALIDAGLVRLEIGVQSINDKINHEIYGRMIKKERVIETAKMLEKYRYKIRVCYDFILDNPWESDETRLESLGFILSLKKPFNIFLFSLTLYPGTELLERAKKEGIITDEFNQVYRKNHMVLGNNKISTLFLLYINYNLPKGFIESLIKTRNFFPVRKFLGNSTYFLIRLSNYYTGLRDSIKTGNKEMRDYYLKSPLRNPLGAFRH